VKILSHRTEILTLLIAVLATGIFFGRTISSEPFAYDEADYMYAVSKGFVASYLDRPSISLFDFVKMGIQGGLHSGERQNLSEYIRHKDDISFYRHYHAPLYFYWVNLMRFAWGPKEFVARLASLLGLLLTAVVVYLGTLALAGRDGRFVGLLAASFLLLSPTNIETARWTSPHSLYVSSALATLFFLGKLIQTKNLQFLCAGLVCLGLSFLTIEYAPLLLVVLLATVLLHRKELFEAWPRAKLIRFALKCALVPLLTIAVLWPGGLYKLTLIKNYLWYGYYATVASGEYGAESLTHIWFIRLMSSPFE
jgi:4-amino-4-deoxy-L-arabinose transferase-like glycosyltransferase